MDKICEECGDDLAQYGMRYCTDCLERLDALGWLDADDPIDPDN